MKLEFRRLREQVREFPDPNDEDRLHVLMRLEG